MVELITAGKQIDVDVKALRFNITLSNPYFGNLSSFVFNFSVPATALNCSLFKHPNRLNRLNRSSFKQPGQIIVDGVELASGTWTLKTFTEQSLELSFSFIADQILSALSGKLLPDLFDIPISTDNIIHHVQNTVLKTYPDTNYQFPTIYAPDFYSGENPAFFGYLNNFEGIFVDDINSNTIVPMLYLFYIVRRIFHFAGFNVSGKIFNDELLQKALIFNNHSLDRLVSTFFEGTIRDFRTTADRFFVILFDSVSNESNLYVPLTGKYKILGSGVYQISCNLDISHTLFDPATYRIDFVVESNSSQVIIHSFSGAYYHFPSTINFNFSATLTPSNSLFFVRIRKTSDLDQRVFIHSGNITIDCIDQSKINIFTSSFNLKNHVPNIDPVNFLQSFFDDYQVFPIIDNINRNVVLVSFSDLLNSIPQSDLTQALIANSLIIHQNNYEGCSLKFDFDYNTVFVPDRIDAEVMTFTELPANLIGHFVYLVHSLNAYYVNTLDTSTNTWSFQFLANINPFFIDPPNKKQIKLSFAPLFMRAVLNRFEFPRSLPIYNEPGTSHAYKLHNDCPLRILFYIGYLESLADHQSLYPFASTSIYNTTGDRFLPINYFASEVAARYWAKTLSWFKTRFQIEFSRYFTPTELKSLNSAQLQMFLDSTIIIDEVFTAVDAKLKHSEIKAWSSF